MYGLYYTRLVYLWEDKENGIVYALMARWKRWFLVERKMHRRLRLEDLYNLPINKD